MGSLEKGKRGDCSGRGLFHEIADSDIVFTSFLIYSHLMALETYSTTLHHYGYYPFDGVLCSFNTTN